MEGCGRYGALAALVALLASGAPAAGYEDVESRTNAEGVEVVIVVGEDGEPAARGRGGRGGSGDSCDWSVLQYPFTGADPPARYGRPPSPEHRLYLVFCDGEFVAARWIGPGGDDTPVVDTAGLARTVVDQVPVDLFTVAAKPDGGRAVTGIPSYFWVEGYDGAPIEGSVTNGPVTVDVEITLGTVTWDFGDGTPPLVTDDLGDPWPAESSIRHAYRDRGTYTVTVTIEMPARFTVTDTGAGGAEPPQDLAPVIRTSTMTISVDEVQAVRTG